MHVQVRHRLTGLFFAIHNESITVIQFELRGKLFGNDVKMTKQGLVTLADVFVRAKHLLGNDQDMSRRLGVDIAKRQALVVFVHHFCWNLAIDDLLEQIDIHHFSLPSDARSIR